MMLPETVRATLASIGQVAAELPCQIDGYREFVSVFRFQTARHWGFQSQFPYLDNCDIAYEVQRYRVDAELIRIDYDFFNGDLVGLQSICVATEHDVVEILRMWAVPPEMLRSPRETEVPL